MGSKAENLNFGKYRLVAELGSGGMGDVFLAIAQGPRNFNKLQVVKRLRPELAEDDEFLGMFLNEARLAARLNHPNVVQTNEVGEEAGVHFIAMEYLEGQSLHAVLRRAQGRFPLAMHVRVIAEVCAGLHHAHELLDFDGTPLSVVHRDCSPQNIFLTYDGGVKVLDFGIAKAADTSSYTRTGVLKGKVPYMAPEQLEGHDVDRRVDIFAVGSMLWEAATGTRLWKGLNDVQIAHRIHLGDIPAPSSANPDVNDHLEAIVMKCLAMDREARYPTAAALQHDLELVVEELGGATTRDIGKWVATAFVETRRQLRSRIEQELKQLLAGRAASGEVPLWRSAENPAARSGEHAAVRDAPTLTAPIDVGAAVSLSPLSSGELVARTPISSARGLALPLPQAAPPVGEPAATTQSSLPISERTGRRSLFPDLHEDTGRRRRVLALLFGGVVVATVLLVLVIRGREPASGAAKSGGAETPVAKVTGKEVAPSATALTTKAEGAYLLTLEIEPKDAKIYLDDQLVTKLRHTLLAGEEHVVRVEATGFLPRTEKLKLDKDATLRVTLDPASAKHDPTKPAAKGPKSVPEPNVTPGPSGFAPAPTASSVAKPKPTLDREDPWQK
ncbi:MAG: serine/threonine protein kinase [Myxococcales bacterium]|nr:serine/threonine protein kinase [Myxococcales bacterium]